MFGTAPPRLTPRDREPSLRNVRLLLVDDDADTREALAAVLASYESEVKVAASVADALATLRAWQPDVLISDVSLPGEDGYALIRQVRALGGRAGGRIPAVALTGNVLSEDRVRLLSAGFQMHVAKPVDVSELVHVIACLAANVTVPLVTAAASALPIADAPLPAPDAASPAHDLRQPLFAMRLWLNLLESEVATTLSSEGRAHLAQLRASIAAMDAIISRKLGPKS